MHICTNAMFTWPVQSVQSPPHAALAWCVVRIVVEAYLLESKVKIPVRTPSFHEWLMIVNNCCLYMVNDGDWMGNNGRQWFMGGPLMSDLVNHGSWLVI